MSLSGTHLSSSAGHILGLTNGALIPNGFHASARARTPVRNGSSAPEPEVIEDDARTLRFRELFAASESKIDELFSRQEVDEDNRGDGGRTAGPGGDEPSGAVATSTRSNDASSKADGASKPTPKKSARVINEDDYDDDSEDDDDDDTAGPVGDDASPLKARSTGATGIPNISSPHRPFNIPPSPALTSTQPSERPNQGKSAEDVRKSLEEDKKAAEQAVKRDFQLYFFPLDNDKENMLEQQKLEEVERQAEMEMNGQNNNSSAAATGGTLSQANLGASSLAFKHLIARIDAKRQQVQASDQQLRNLMVEVKKNRSKWASEDKIGQEELYEAADKVLSEIKAGTEYSQPFLTRVNKREAPDYYNVIKHAMDLSTMTKKLKGYQYKSKKEFVEDLNWIWQNCLKYNSDPSHPLRKNATRFRKEIERLSPLIPDIVVRDRAEVEAEERRAAAADLGEENAEDSDDEPIIAARGRIAPGKKAKKGASAPARKGTSGGSDTPAPESKPSVNGVGGRADVLRADSEIGDMNGSQHGLGTPPPGSMTPAGANGIHPSSHADAMDVDGASAAGGVGLITEVDYDDAADKLWKQVTKKDRAHATAERNRLFKTHKIESEQPALLRSRAGMRKWLRQQAETDGGGVLGKRKREEGDDDGREQAATTDATLAEGMDQVEERVLPDYYEPLSALPDINKRLKWTEDSDGAVEPNMEETLRVVPAGHFTSLNSNFSRRLNANIRQMQETRKICKKIDVVRQMQLQTQVYQNQFQKYEPEPFIEKDIDPHVVSDEGAIMSRTVCQAAMRRSVAQICYMAGFEECQPSALDAMGELAMDYFVKLARTFNEYLEMPKQKVQERIPGTSEFQTTYKPHYTLEESLLQTLAQNEIELPALESYVKEDMEKTSTKLGVLHERMKAHLAELLRPALEDNGDGGVSAFKDGSEQFVGGDFAEELGEDFFGFRELGLDKEFGLASVSVPLHLLQNRMHNAYATQNNNATGEEAEVLPPPAPFAAVTLKSLPGEIGLVRKFFEQKILNANKASDPKDPELRAKPLTEDEDLPQKQRFPKPRLPPNGKITSPRKKPIRHDGPGKGHPKKSMRLVEGHGWVKNSEADEIERKMREEEARKKAAQANPGASSSSNSKTNGTTPKTPSKLRLETGSPRMSRTDSRMTDGDGDGDGDADADGDADGDDDDGDDGPIIQTKMGKNKERPNGMISPESLGASA